LEVLLMSLPVFVIDMNLASNPRADCCENYAEDDPTDPDEDARQPLDTLGRRKHGAILEHRADSLHRCSLLLDRSQLTC
jgi:hypothetical protein